MLEIQEKLCVHKLNFDTYHIASFKNIYFVKIFEIRSTIRIDIAIFTASNIIGEPIRSALFLQVRSRSGASDRTRFSKVSVLILFKKFIQIYTEVQTKNLILKIRI